MSDEEILKRFKFDIELGVFSIDNIVAFKPNSNIEREKIENLMKSDNEFKIIKPDVYLTFLPLDIDGICNWFEFSSKFLYKGIPIYILKDCKNDENNIEIFPDYVKEYKIEDDK